MRHRRLRPLNCHKPVAHGGLIGKKTSDTGVPGALVPTASGTASWLAHNRIKTRDKAPGAKGPGEDHVRSAGI